MSSLALLRGRVARDLQPRMLGRQVEVLSRSAVVNRNPVEP